MGDPSTFVDFVNIFTLWVIHHLCGLCKYFHPMGDPSTFVDCKYFNPMGDSSTLWTL